MILKLMLMFRKHLNLPVNQIFEKNPSYFFPQAMETILPLENNFNAEKGHFKNKIVKKKNKKKNLQIKMHCL